MLKSDENLFTENNCAKNTIVPSQISNYLVHRNSHRCILLGNFQRDKFH